MRNKVLIASLVALSFAASCGVGAVGDTADDLTSATNLRNTPIKWSLGDWTCTGRYFDSPFTQAHTVTASFHVAQDVGDTWFTGHYQEVQSSNGQLMAIVDSFTMDPFVTTGGGLRSFIDSNTGQFVGGLQVVGTTEITFDGTYTVAHQAVPFREDLQRENDATGVTTAFSTSSEVILGGQAVVFETQRCVHGSVGTK